MRLLALLTLVLISFSSCDHPKEKSKPSSGKFIYPEYVEDSASVALGISIDSMLETGPQIYGWGTSGDINNLNLLKEKIRPYKEVYKIYNLDKENVNCLQVVIDTILNCKLLQRDNNFYGVYLHKKTGLLNNPSLDCIGIYVFNSSLDSQLLPMNWHRILLIQEAKNPTGIWQPIEYQEYDSSSLDAIMLKPKGYVFTKELRYKGDFRTLLRFRLQIGKNNIYSKPFVGSINWGQFALPQSFDSLQRKKFPFIPPVIHSYSMQY
jgi:hypothetical protein